MIAPGLFPRRKWEIVLWGPGRPEDLAKDLRLPYIGEIWTKEMTRPISMNKKKPNKTEGGR